MPHDDFAFEPVKGLPAEPPKGEAVLWQGRPDTLALAREAMALYWVAAYFALLTLWRIVSATSELPLSTALLSGVPLLVLGLLACGIILLIAWVQARATVYTITTARVAMRVGAALTVTFNLPYTSIVNAALDLRRSGTGTVALELKGDTRISYLVCWPHVRPWHMKKTQPALRCIPDAARVARLLAEAAETRVSAPAVAPAGAGAHRPAAVAAE